jgi:hypothetical protein
MMFVRKIELCRRMKNVSKITNAKASLQIVTNYSNNFKKKISPEIFPTIPTLQIALEIG